MTETKIIEGQDTLMCFAHFVNEHQRIDEKVLSELEIGNEVSKFLTRNQLSGNYKDTILLIDNLVNNPFRQVIFSGDNSDDTSYIEQCIELSELTNVTHYLYDNVVYILADIPNKYIIESDKQIILINLSNTTIVIYNLDIDKPVANKLYLAITKEGVDNGLVNKYVLTDRINNAKLMPIYYDFLYRRVTIDFNIGRDPVDSFDVELIDTMDKHSLPCVKSYSTIEDTLEF